MPGPEINARGYRVLRWPDGRNPSTDRSHKICLVPFSYIAQGVYPNPRPHSSFTRKRGSTTMTGPRHSSRILRRPCPSYNLMALGKHESSWQQALANPYDTPRPSNRVNSKIRHLDRRTERSHVRTPPPITTLASNTPRPRSYNNAQVLTPCHGTAIRNSVIRARKDGGIADSVKTRLPLISRAIAP